jgi:hypothetical protein
MHTGNKKGGSYLGLLILVAAIAVFGWLGVRAWERRAQVTEIRLRPNPKPAATVPAAVGIPLKIEYTQPEYCKEVPLKPGEARHAWEVPIHAMDVDLDATERDQTTCGFFTDVFVPNAAYALKMGASRAEVKKRVDRLVALADKGKFLSGYEEDLFKYKNGGSAAIRKYVEEHLDEK